MYPAIGRSQSHRLTVRKTARYRLAEALAGIVSDDPEFQLGWAPQSLILLTATPHMGKPYPYFAPSSASGFDLWRQDEDRRRVKTIVGAFAERPKLPKMLRRKDLVDTMSNGCIQGLYVLSLPRPDGTARTWWRMPIDESELNDDALEAVQNSAAVLDSRPG
jgi:hypothetical protein